MYIILITLIFSLVSMPAQSSSLFTWSAQLSGQASNTQFNKMGVIYVVVPGFNDDPISQNGNNPSQYKNIPIQKSESSYSEKMEFARAYLQVK